MKKYLFLLVLLACCFVCKASDFSAVAPTGHTLYYNIISASDRTVEVTYPGSSTSNPWSGYTKPTGSLIIPSSVTLNGYTYSVTSIGEYAFSGRSGLTSVGIPYSVTTIGENAFEGCSGLTTVLFSASVTTICSHAFSGCSSLTSVTIPYSVSSIGNYAFSGCSRLTSITIPYAVTTIGSHVFSGCSSLSSVTIPYSVTSIGAGAFHSCHSLTSITIPISVTNIGEAAFQECSGLTSVTIGNSVTTIGERAFRDCSSLNSVIIPNSVTSIGSYAFSGCSCLYSVTIPSSVTHIGDRAFSGCSGLTSVFFNAINCTTMGSYSYPVFSGCTNLSSLTIGDSVRNIPYFAFMGCSGLTSVTIGNSVTTIGERAFYDCSGLTSITIPNSVTYINYYAFCDCSGLTSLSIPNSVTYIDGYAFEDCSGLTSVIIGNSVTSIGCYAFSGCSGLTSVIIPDSVTSIGTGAFHDCGGLTSIIFNAINCTSMENSPYPVFSGCTNLSSLTIGDSVQYIPSYAFSGCSGLTSLTIPDSVTSIGTGAFYDCSGLTSVVFNAINCASMGSSSCPVFSGCTNLSSITIGDSVQIIPSYAFYGCSNLTSITIPHSVTSIRNRTFYGCSSLHTIISNNPTAPTLGGNCFYNCPIQEIHIPCGSLDSYSLRWSSYGDYLQEPDAPSFQRVLQSADTTIGEVSLLTLFCADTSTISAIPNYGYHFTKWSDNNTDNPRTFVLTQDTTFTALFAISQYAIVGTSASDMMGAVIGSDTADYLQHVTLTALPNYGYHFTQWSDGNTQNPRTIVADSNKTYTAQFDYNTYTLSVSSDNPTMGTVAGVGSFNYLSTQNVSATANYGYHFTQWSDGNTDNPRSIVLIKDTSLTAEFDYNQYAITGTSESNVMGVVTGSNTVDYLQSVTLTATANYGYHFTQWSDGNTQNPRTVVADSSKTYTAHFDYNNYTLSVSSDNPAMGIVAGAGSFNYLSTQNVSATANYGYHFTQWNDGNTDNPRSIVLTQDTTFTAEFDYNQYAITGTSESNVMGAVTGSNTVDYLQSVTLTATANYGYHFTQWNDGNTQNPRTIVADSNKTYTAQFDYNNYTLSVSSDNPAMGTVVGSGSFNYLSTQNISATANYGYHFTQWNDGNTNNPRSIVLTHDTTFIAEFGHNQYTVTSASADTIMGSTFGDSIVDYLQQVTLTALPNYGYHFIQWNDGNTQNPRTIVADSNKTYIAQFGYNTYMVAKSCDTLQGNVMGVDSADYLSNVTLTAIPSYGYHFTQWSDSVASNPRTFVLTQDTTFTAEFERNSYTITCVTNDVSLGQVQGSGTYLYLDTIELTATAVDHYHFTHWQDGNTENPRSIVVYSDSIITAQFAIDTQHIVVMSSDINMGYVSGGGDIIYGQPVTVEATAYSGYHFSCWSNGSRYNPYTFAAIQDLTLEAIFISDEAPYYTITVAANNAAMGSVTGSGTYDDGTVAVITATPHEGCIFLHWNDGDTATERMITVNATATYTAYFVPESCNVTTSINDANAGTVSGDGIYRMGDTITLTATANEGYLFTQWSDGNTETLRTIVVDENLSEAMQPLDGTTYGITFTAYFEPLQGIDDLEISNLSIRAQQGHIVIEGAQNEMVRVFDITGRTIVASKATTEHYNVSIQQTGVYFVKVGDRKAEKVVVLR